MPEVSVEVDGAAESSEYLAEAEAIAVFGGVGAVGDGRVSLEK